ncbi:ubiquitin domain-containing protein/HECT domain-containing protein [Cephalotus follicularis]|uniref:HECT-type E3 ubiquitin transferase n=1 Tax=Cephalotus follicularis TaxID=3775 RepID=A0A1Q3BB62_CEPFO|nr:ubiquitin domain-containing protein/HECT domain-containing protein [Cephalotus follicularis]
MSLVDPPSTDSVHSRSSPGHDHRLSSKRKLDDYAPSFDDDDYDLDCDSVSVRMRKDEPNRVHSSSNGPRHSHTISVINNNSHAVVDAKSVSTAAGASSSASCSSSAPSPIQPSVSEIQFFIRMISGWRWKTMVTHAKSDDTIKSLHQRIQSITGIPVMEQRLIYRGKQLQWEQTLAECYIQNDASLQLVGRMRSTGHPQTWQLIDSLISIVLRLCRGESAPSSSSKQIVSLITDFFTQTPAQKDDDSLAIGHLQVFLTSSAPAALVMLYKSSIKGNKECGDNVIRHFLNSSKNVLLKPVHTQCAIIVLEFCKLLRIDNNEDPLYLTCRSTLGSFLETVGISWGVKNGEEVKGLIVVEEIFPFVSELATRLSKDLVLSMESSMDIGPLLSDVRDFTAFLLPLRAAITEQMGAEGQISLPLKKKRGYNHPFYGEEIEHLYRIFHDLLSKMDKCLNIIESFLPVKESGDGEISSSGWSQYLAILKELNGISKLYHGAEEKFWMVLRMRKTSLCALIIRSARRTEDHQWLLGCKDVTNFESRRHLVMIMFPEVKEDYEELHEMLIDRSQLLAESFEYIQHADPESLHGGLFMEFKNEEATGPGVLREWFYLVGQAIFNPQNALFVACPDDRRRFYPNPASKVDPMHLEYFSFSGRVIALALMHKVQLGVVFDRVFFLQLAGRHISLEDIRDADPFLYSSCKKILEMDAEFVDSDCLGLTFVREVEELGSRRVVDLCPGGKSIVVNSKNREEYVKLLIRNRFVTSISEQVSHFAQGFADILSNARLQKLFFQSLELEDLDWMLHGSEKAISVEDWMAHTDYNGFNESDPQINWFWKIVGEMSAEQRKVLLFFWTSVKHLPVEGFHGLASRLSIYKSPEPHDHLPSTHTCFYRLCFPQYPSIAVMQDRLYVITQEHVGCSFGTW